MHHKVLDMKINVSEVSMNCEVESLLILLGLLWLAPDFEVETSVDDLDAVLHPELESESIIHHSDKLI